MNDHKIVEKCGPEQLNDMISKHICDENEEEDN